MTALMFQRSPAGRPRPRGLRYVPAVPDASASPDEDKNTGSADPDPIGLNQWERGAAALVGVILAGFGIWATFVVDSEVGPPALVLIAAVFLLLAIQGTAIRRANTDSVELDRRASPRHIAREAASVLEEEGPSEANSFIEGASAAAPSLMRSPAFFNVQDAIRRALSYERDVRYIIESSMDDEVTLFRYPDDSGMDFAVKSRKPDGKLVDCIVKYSRGLQTGFYKDLRKTVKQLQPELRIAPILIITNHEIDKELVLQQVYEGSKPRGIEVVTWRDPRDTENLKRIIGEMIAGS